MLPHRTVEQPYSHSLAGCGGSCPGHILPHTQAPTAATGKAHRAATHDWKRGEHLTEGSRLSHGQAHTTWWEDQPRPSDYWETEWKALKKRREKKNGHKGVSHGHEQAEVERGNVGAHSGSKAEVNIWNTAEPRAQEPSVEPHILLLLMVSVFCGSDSNPRPCPYKARQALYRIPSQTAVLDLQVYAWKRGCSARMHMSYLPIS